MGFLDKALGYEEKVISTVEMAELIEEKILKKECTSAVMYEINLDLVKDAMRKDWILIIRGASTRDYLIVDCNLKISVRYSVITHTMQHIQLTDNQEKIIYSIPKGRENAKDLCSKVLARVERYQKK